MLTYNGTTIKHMNYNGQKVKKWNHNGVRVFTAGSTVTYYVDSGTSYTEEVDSEASCLSPKTFTPTKSGWTFVGWREDKTASSSVLSSKVMGDSPIVLYAVFKKAVTVTYYNNSTTASSTSGYRYYNNGNIVNPSFTLTQASKSGWTAVGWSTSNTGNGGITYNNGAAFARDSNVTLYGRYNQTITVTYYNGSTSASTTSGTRCYNSNGNVVNPSFTLTQAALSGWTARGWSTSTAGNGGISYNNGATFTRDSSITLYAMYYQTITLSYNGNSATSGGVSAQSNNRYYNSGSGNVVNPSFSIAANGFARTNYSFIAWALGSTGGARYGAGATITLDASNTLFAVWSKNEAVLLNTGDNMSNTVYRWYMPMDLEGAETDTGRAQTAPGCYPTASTSIDCTDYNYCKVRVYAQDCGAEPGGYTQNNYDIYLGFTTTYSGAAWIARKTAGSSIGTYGEGTAYDKWADIVINVSALSGAQRLHCIGHRDCPGGSGYFNVWLSKITMYN